MASQNDVTGIFGMDTCDGILCALSFEATLCIIHSQPSVKGYDLLHKSRSEVYRCVRILDLHSPETLA